MEHKDIINKLIQLAESNEGKLLQSKMAGIRDETMNGLLRMNSMEEMFTLKGRVMGMEQMIELLNVEYLRKEIF